MQWWCINVHWTNSLAIVAQLFRKSLVNFHLSKLIHYWLSIHRLYCTQEGHQEGCQNELYQLQAQHSRALWCCPCGLATFQTCLQPKQSWWKGQSSEIAQCSTERTSAQRILSLGCALGGRTSSTNDCKSGTPHTQRSSICCVKEEEGYAPRAQEQCYHRHWYRRLIRWQLHHLHLWWVVLQLVYACLLLCAIHCFEVFTLFRTFQSNMCIIWVFMTV